MVEAQGSDLLRLKGQRIVIPFELENNFIVVKTTLNDRYRLKFIVDTGAENTILLDKTLTDELKVDYRRKFSVIGSDRQQVLVAYLATGIDLQLAESVVARHRAMLVLEENYANLDQHVGTDIHGILGADFLSRFVLEIDYRRRQILLHDPQGYRPRAKFLTVPSEFVRHRAYLNLPINFTSQQASNRKVLLDSGAGITLLLHTFGDTTVTEDLPVPTLPSTLAHGISGELNGNVGRASSLSLGPQRLEDVITYFQPVDTTELNFLSGRQGIIGNKILRRFTVVIDYIRHEVYVRPDIRQVRRRFKYDRSGLSITAGGDRLRQFYVARVIPGSPADEAGLQIGDRIAAVNNTSVTFLTLGGILNRLRGKVGRQVKLKYVREGNYQRTNLRLRELI